MATIKGNLPIKVRSETEFKLLPSWSAGNGTERFSFLMLGVDAGGMTDSDKFGMASISFNREEAIAIAQLIIKHTLK